MASIPFLSSIDLSTYPSSPLPRSVLYAGGIFAIITAGNLDNAFQLLRDTVGRHAVFLEVTNVQTQQDVIDLLDEGLCLE
jgi:phosphoribosyl-ATP pyrophosphohydrolase / phosphoribosyl-AMP cyclohydrolase / histidinol dehydrogenase